MATAGSGDVLAGVIGSFAAQGLSPAQAALDGVIFHSLAGDAVVQSGKKILLASDIIEAFPKVDFS
jgi:ADP-dependent NAD(P)H-hydrate dehydratase / NAD(P)H-hydrate epimerase